jgi:type II secretory pathway component PulC
MAMPKGFKSENGYGTSKLFDGMTYHEIADNMRESGYKMNHSTARNVFVNALIKVADEIVDLYQLDLSDKDLKRLAINPDFQDSVRGFLSELQIERQE